MVRFSRADCPADAQLVGFSFAPRLIPPTIQNAQVQSAVCHRFHAAGATRFQGSPGCVQPNVGTLHEAACTAMS